MTSLTSALDQLREERRRAQREVEQLDKAIVAIEGIVNGQSSAGERSGRRTISTAGRRRIAEAQRARWATLNGSKPAIVTVRGAGRRRRTMSTAARRKIAAAQRARWARFRQQTKGAA